MGLGRLRPSAEFPRDPAARRKPRLCGLCGRGPNVSGGSEDAGEPMTQKHMIPHDARGADDPAAGRGGRAREGPSHKGPAEKRPVSGSRREAARDASLAPGGQNTGATSTRPRLRIIRPPATKQADPGGRAGPAGGRAKTRGPNRPDGAWKYRDRNRQKPIALPGHPDGRIGRVTIVHRNNTVNLRWRQQGHRHPLWERIGSWDEEDVLSRAIKRADQINQDLAERGSTLSFKKATVAEGCDGFLASKEAGGTASGAAIRKYRAEIARIVAFAERAREGRRCRLLHRIDTSWVEELSHYLAAISSTRNGGRPTERNPERPLSQKVRRGILQRLHAILEHARLRTPPLVPPPFRNPVTRELIGRDPRREEELSEPPVSVDELVMIVAVLDAYALGLLAPEFEYGPRPSEIGRILQADHDAANAFLLMKSRPETGYRTKGRRNKAWPLTEALAACLRPFLLQGLGPIFVKRRVFEGKARPILANADETALAAEYVARQKTTISRLGHALKKEEIDAISRRVWTDAGAVTVKDVARELARAARRAGLTHVPTPKDVRHLVESQCEAARLAPGVIRHLLGHAPPRGDMLIHYNHTGREVLREQVAILNERRKPLIDALLERARELG